jgi:MFS family permease
VLAFLMTTMALGSIEGTIVATAMPSIVSTLGGFELFSWVFSAYLLAQAVFTPICGSLADTLGRKPVLLTSITVFLAASLACGFADSMPVLIAFRFLQGVGAAGIGTMVVTLAGDLYTVRERGRVQAYLASVWGVSSVLGPLIGGIVVANVDWAWVFWFNVPFGLAALFGLSRFLHERVEHRRRQLDVQGAVMLFVTMAGLMVLLNLGGSLSQPLRVALSVFTAVVALWLVRRLLTVAGAILPLDLWSDRLIMLANLSAFVAGIVMIGVISYAPAYVQGVMGFAPIVAGFALSTMSFGWPLASSAAGRLLIPLGPASVARMGGLAVVIGGILYLLLRPSLGPWWVAASSFAIGLGMGAINTSSIVSIQSSVPWQRRATATAGNLLMRLLGNSAGAALLGGVLNASLGARIAKADGGSDVTIAAIERIMSPEAAGTPPPRVGATVDASGDLLRQILAGGLHDVFLVVFCATVVLVGLTMAWPRKRRLE